MEFTNDLDTVGRWLRRNIGPCEIRATEKEEKQLNDIATACMSVYRPRTGDKQIMGFFPFSELQGVKGNVRDADGICAVSRDGKTAAIGIRFDVLTQQHPDYAAACIGLHEVAHLRYDEHNDDFVSYLIQLQYDYFKKGV